MDIIQLPHKTLIFNGQNTKRKYTKYNDFAEICTKKLGCVHHHFKICLNYDQKKKKKVIGLQMPIILINDKNCTRRNL